MTVTQYVHHRGCAESTVRRAIKDGRIAEAVIKVEGKTMIKTKQADKLWTLNTDPKRANNYLGAKGQGKLYDSKAKGEQDLEEHSDDQPEGAQNVPNFQTHRAIKEAYAARMAKLNYEKESGKLIEVEKVKAYILKIHTRARDSLLNITDKLSPKLASENDIHKVSEIINKEIQIVCDQFSKGEIDLK